MAAVEERVQRLRQQGTALAAGELANHCRAADALVAEMEATRDLGRTWLCCDLDAFYASCEQRDDPSLAGGRSHPTTALCGHGRGGPVAGACPLPQCPAPFCSGPSSWLAAGKPFAVGGMSMISTASYEARKFGVRSAMPGELGAGRCWSTG